MRRLKNLAETYGTSALAFVCALVALLGWLVTQLAWAVIEALHGQAEPRMTPGYLVLTGTLVFTVVAVAAAIARLNRSR